MKADRKNPTMIQVTSNGTVIGRMTTKEFRGYMNNTTAFLQKLINDFNEMKANVGEPERVEQVINAA